MSSWQEIADRVFVGRYTMFDQTIGAILGEDELLVVDTRTTPSQARELQDDLRRLSPHPWRVVNTHHHFDHTFGNAQFRPAEIWGHERCARRLRGFDDAQRAELIHALPDLAGELSAVEIVPPTNTLTQTAQLEIGGRPVELRHLGRGHTDNDVIVIVPDAAVLLAGDLVEEGAPPSFGDSYPLEWPETNDRLLSLVRGAVVPGHGVVVDRSFVQAQTADLRLAADAARSAHAAGEPIRAAVERVPFPEPFALECVGRAYAQLEGSPG